MQLRESRASADETGNYLPLARYDCLELAAELVALLCGRLGQELLQGLPRLALVLWVLVWRFFPVGYHARQGARRRPRRWKTGVGSRLYDCLIDLGVRQAVR